MKKLFQLICLTILLSACADLFKAEDIRGPVITDLKQEDKDIINSVPNKPIKDLDYIEQSKVAGVVFSHLQDNLDHRKITKLACHSAAIFADLSTNECRDTRENCLKEVNEYNDADLKRILQNGQWEIEKFVRDSQARPKHFAAAFEALNFAMNLVAKLDCGDNEAKQKEAETEAINFISKKYTDLNDAKIIYDLLKSLVEYVTEDV